MHILHSNALMKNSMPKTKSIPFQLPLLDGLAEKCLYLLLLGVFLAPSFKKATALVIPPGTVKYVDGKTKKREFDVLQITGGIAHPIALEIKDILKARNSNRKLLIHLDSGGGSMKEGEKIIDMLQAEKEKGQIIYTTVHNGEICGSMCVPIYLQGKKRYAGEVSAFMFHGVTNIAMTNIPNRLRTEMALKVFIEAGVSERWIELMWERKAFSTPGSYWMTAKQLVEEGAGIVTDILPAHDIEEPRRAPFDPLIRPR